MKTEALTSVKISYFQSDMWKIRTYPIRRARDSAFVTSQYPGQRTTPNRTGSLGELSLAYSGVRSHRLAAQDVCLSVWRSHYSETHSLPLTYVAYVRMWARTYATYKAESARFKRVTNGHSPESGQVCPASIRMKRDEMQIGKKPGK